MKTKRSLTQLHMAVALKCASRSEALLIISLLPLLLEFEKLVGTYSQRRGCGGDRSGIMMLLCRLPVSR